MPNTSSYLPDTENPIDDYVLKRIKYRVRALIGRYGFLRCDEEDLQQELILFVLEAVQRFDPAKSSWPTFLDRSLDGHIRTLIRQSKKQPEVESLSDVVGDRVETIFAAPDAHEDLAQDVKDVIATLPDNLRETCEQLKCGDLNVTARALGIRRRTLLKRMIAIRQHFEAAGVTVEHLAA